MKNNKVKRKISADEIIRKQMRRGHIKNKLDTFQYQENVH